MAGLTIGQALAFLQERHREMLEGVLITPSEPTI
jgi:hypothetical protein